MEESKTVQIIRLLQKETPAKDIIEAGFSSQLTYAVIRVIREIKAIVPGQVIRAENELLRTQNNRLIGRLAEVQRFVDRAIKTPIMDDLDG